jgi:hypothetical protein
MNRDEWNGELELRPLTPNQRGAVMREFARLGIADRAERLAAIAALLGIDALGSTGELTQGQAGQLVNTLERITDPAELPQVAAVREIGDSPDTVPRDRGEVPGLTTTGRLTWSQVFTRALAVVYLPTRGGIDSGEPGQPGSPE